MREWLFKWIIGYFPKFLIQVYATLNANLRRESRRSENDFKIGSIVTNCEILNIKFAEILHRFTWPGNEMWLVKFLKIFLAMWKEVWDSSEEEYFKLASADNDDRRFYLSQVY